MNSNFKKTPKKSLSWTHFHNYHEVTWLCSSPRKTHRRNRALTDPQILYPLCKQKTKGHALACEGSRRPPSPPAMHQIPAASQIWCCGLVFNWRDTLLSAERARCDSGENLSSSHTAWSTLSLCLPRARGWNPRIFKVSPNSNRSVIVSKLQVSVRKGRRSRCVTARGKGDNSPSQRAFSPRCPCFIFRYSLPIVLKACVQNEQLYFALTGEMFPANRRGMMYCRLTRAARLDHRKCFQLWES